jgi:hypothetical protein
VQKAFVGIEKASVCEGADADADWRSVKGFGKSFFGRTQGGFGALSVGDVLDGAGDVDGVDGGVFADCAVAAVGEYETVVDAVRLFI